ncbi:hypothetical protein A2U01_0082390, partial [Trifolium medium]|nr:hypothetical protein [Trifolium medium]
DDQTNDIRLAVTDLLPAVRRRPPRHLELCPLGSILVPSWSLIVSPS